MKTSTSKRDATNKRVSAMIFAKLYQQYITKAEKKGRTKAEVDKTSSSKTQNQTYECTYGTQNASGFPQSRGV